MSLSIQLARIFSFYLILVGVSMLINPSFYRAAVKEIASNDVAMMIIGATTLIVGMVLVTLHNVWVHDWRVSITLFCWLILLSGTIRTLFPRFVQGMAARLSSTEGLFLQISTAVCFILGLYYGYLGFH